MQLVLNPGYDPKMTASATNGPEQIRVLLGIHCSDLPIGRDEIYGNQVINGQAILAIEATIATAQCEPTDAGM